MTSDAIAKRSPGQEKARQYAIAGFLIDGSHHKQWILEHILVALGINLDQLCQRLSREDYSWKEGIAP